MYGKYIDAEDLEQHLQYTMQGYLDEAAKPEVVIQEGSRFEQRIEHVKRELLRLQGDVSKTTHLHRQQMLMRFVGARLRKPQRLTTLSLAEERCRWCCILQAYDRLLWESMRPELLGDRVLDPVRFVEGLQEK